MDVEKQMPLMNNNLDNVKASDCCAGHADESSTKHALVRQSCCNVGCHQGGPRHQSSVDSGYGNTLDPISEHQEYHPNGDIKPGTDDVTCQCQHRKKSTSVVAEQAVQCCKDQSPKCNCADSNATPQSCCGRNGYSHMKEETEFMAGRTCIRSPRSTMPVPAKCHSYPLFPGELQLQSAAPKGERFRSVSGSSYSDETFCNHGRSDHVITYGPDTFWSAAESNVVAKRPRKFQRCRCLKILIGVFIVFVVGVGVASVISYFVHDGKMKKMEAKIAELEHEIGQVAKSAPSSFEALTSRGTDARPRVHMKLKSQGQIPVNPWNGRTLQWIPDITGGVGIEYDDSKNSLIVHEAGVYFVYNQIYVFRHVPQDAGVMTSLSNHTMFHTLYKRPFNYSLKRKPRRVTESALTNCWNSNAGRQVHSSYQGIIVKMKRNEELLVALDDYDESMDSLDPSSTFFGAFKL